MSAIRITWHGYRYYPYERELARREAAQLIAGAELAEQEDGLSVPADVSEDGVKRLTYFAALRNGHEILRTTQHELEAQGRTSQARQATRYSVHGLHEYKGKFNPQVAKSLMNVFGIGTGDAVLDPFCGSGTTLIEAVQLGANANGTDLNPFAVYVANAKLAALTTKAAELSALVDRLQRRLKRPSRRAAVAGDDDRIMYLRKWFNPPELSAIEWVKSIVVEVCAEKADIFLSIASDLLRDYSLQDPNDLRIRRRKSPLPPVPFEAAFLAKCAEQVRRIESAQSVLGPLSGVGVAKRMSVLDLKAKTFPRKFDCAITSPPYAMALPYVDTQRLSLVWLELVAAAEVMRLEADLIGSREFRGASRRALHDALLENAEGLPTAQHDLCCELEEALGAKDGFRRKAVPVLLYRYFAAMHGAFKSVRVAMKRNAPFALVVGHNHTVLGGHRFDIDTPTHLAGLASNAGWAVEEMLPLQTYHRFGYHMANAVGAETLMILRNK